MYRHREQDGNRYRACQATGVEPKTMVWRGKSPVAYVLSTNLHPTRHRQQLQTPGQRQKVPVVGYPRTAPLPAAGGLSIALRIVRADVKTIETLSHDIDDLTAFFRRYLPAEQVKLVWSLGDAVERLGIAEDILRERQRAADVVRHVSGCAHPR